MNSEWNIRSCSDQCVGCEKKFADKEGLMSRLRFTEEGYVREDFCSSCWPERTDAAGDVSEWAAVWLAPTPKPQEPLKKETAESLLRELMETEDVSKRNVIFILAVMLERRRILVEKDVQLQPDGVKIRVYEHKKTGESFVVPDPQLKLKEIETIQLEVMDLLGIPPPPGKGPAAPAGRQEKPASSSPPGTAQEEETKKPGSTGDAT
ncbi:MAG: hypothetical protein LBN38_08855 [Verrucomicrobiota bacterium]|jgi:hypothetical protein|nr:hypothetical protein [Verrucomicrobiota bacterium]